MNKIYTKMDIIKLILSGVPDKDIIKELKITEIQLNKIKKLIKNKIKKGD